MPVYRDDGAYPVPVWINGDPILVTGTLSSERATLARTTGLTRGIKPKRGYWPRKEGYLPRHSLSRDALCQCPQVDWAGAVRNPRHIIPYNTRLGRSSNEDPLSGFWSVDGFFVVDAEDLAPPRTWCLYSLLPGECSSLLAYCLLNDFLGQRQLTDDEV